MLFRCKNDSQQTVINLEPEKSRGRVSEGAAPRDRKGRNIRGREERVQAKTFGPDFYNSSVSSLSLSLSLSP
jgi:hypothetical protein